MSKRLEGGSPWYFSGNLVRFCFGPRLRWLTPSFCHEAVHLFLHVDTSRVDRVRVSMLAVSEGDMVAL